MTDNSGAKFAVSVNQDNSCFAVSTKNGFSIYSVDPFQEMFSRRYPDDEISFVRMLYRTNILAIVTKGRDPTKPFSRLVIWDDHSNASIKEIDFPSTICGVRISKEVIVVVRAGAVHIYDFRTFGMIQAMDTVENKLGIVSLAAGAPRRVISCLGSVEGQIRIMVSNAPSVAMSSNPPTSPTKPFATTLVQAHSTSVVALSLNLDGSRVATASSKGTMVRVFNTETGELLFELHRGTDAALIYSISFRFDSSYLVCSSNKGTVHVFSLLMSASSRMSIDQFSTRSHTSTVLGAAVGSAVNTASAGLSSVMSSVATVLPSFITAQRSFAQFNLSDSTVRNIVAFCSDDSTVMVICQDGRFLRASYGGGGECAIIQDRTFAESSGGAVRSPPT